MVTPLRRPRRLLSSIGGEHSANARQVSGILLYGGGPIESARAGTADIAKTRAESVRDSSSLRMANLLAGMPGVCGELTPPSIHTFRCLTGFNLQSLALPPATRPARLVAYLGEAPHAGKAGVVVLAAVLGAVAWAARTGAIPPIAAGFLAFAGLTGTLFLLSLYDLALSTLELRYKPSESGLAGRFRIASDVAQEYVRWLTPLPFVVGIVFGHYFWQ